MLGGVWGALPPRKKKLSYNTPRCNVAPLKAQQGSSYIYNMNIYFKVVEVQIQASERILKLGRDSSHPGAVPKAHTRKIMEK